MSSVNLYDRRPSVAFNLSLLPSFLSPIFNRNSSTNWSATERVRVRGAGRRRRIRRGVKSVKLHFCEKIGEGAGDSDRATGRRHVPCIMKGGEERGPSLAVRPSIRSIVPFWNENEKRGKFRSFARKKYKVWHAPIDPFGGVAAMSAAL